jgi:hypothetical protein
VVCRQEGGQPADGQQLIRRLSSQQRGLREWEPPSQSSSAARLPTRRFHANEAYTLMANCSCIPLITPRARLAHSVTRLDSCPSVLNGSGLVFHHKLSTGITHRHCCRRRRLAILLFAIQSPSLPSLPNRSLWLYMERETAQVGLPLSHRPIAGSWASATHCTGPQWMPQREVERKDGQQGECHCRLVGL